MSDKLNYTAEDIKRYLEGKMPPEQMHALERAALSDPFLADALEGMELHGDSAKFDADVEELHARLAARAKHRKGAPGSAGSLWWKIAAVLIIVITGVSIIIFTGEKNKTAQNEIVKTEDKIVVEDAKAKSQEEQTKPKAEESASAKQALSTEATKKERPVEKKEQKRAPLKKPTEPVLFNKVDQQTLEKSEGAGVNRDLAASKQPSAAAAPAADTFARQLQGKVAGVDVNDRGSDSMFDEVIVVGYGNSKKKNNRSRTVSAGRAERVIPGKGWEQFERYIEDSTKINTADSVYTGEEHLSFTIGDDGLPESIKILRSISPSHDKEAIRLLQNGPSWKVAKGRKREIRLKIIF